jgi:hypothetical protein
MLALALCVALTAAWSCRNPNEPKLEDYKARVAQLFQAYNTDVQALSAGLKTEGTLNEVFASLAAYAKAGSDRTAAFIADWDREPVPARARAVHAQGKTVIEGYKAAYDQLLAGAQAMDQHARDVFNTALQQELPQRVEQFQQALNALK